MKNFFQQTVQGSSEVVSSLGTSNSHSKSKRFTRQLSSLVGVDKAFRVSAIAKRLDGTEVELEKGNHQADQGSDMNVISLGMTRFLKLELHPVAEIGFQGLSMRTAENIFSAAMNQILLEIWLYRVEVIAARLTHEAAVAKVRGT